MKKLFPLLLACAATTLAQAETRYVTDQLEVTLRKGQSTRHEIVRMLPSGTPVEVLENDAENGYSRVRAPTGAEGWVLTRYLMNTPSARERVENAEKRLAELQQEYQVLKEQSARTSQEKGGLAQERLQLEEQNRALAQQLAEIRHTAANVLAVDEENKTLKSRVLSVERELQTAQQETAALKSRAARDWFMTGAGVMLAGIIIGLILPKLRPRKQPRWDTF